MAYRVKFVLKVFLTAAVLLTAALPARASVPGVKGIEFEYGGDVSFDISSASIGRMSYSEADTAVYGNTAGKYLISDMPIRLKTGDLYRLLLTCASVGSDGGCRGIQAVIADERKTPAAVIQRVKLGDGYAPQLVTSGGGQDSVMFRVIRAGDNTEANVYAISLVTGRITETLAVTRVFPEKMKLDIKGVMTEGGYIEIESMRPKVKETLDLSGALDSLIEDELYQPDGRPIPALVNLKVSRAGWEDEYLYSEGGELRLDVGMSLATLSGKPMAMVTAHLVHSGDTWTVKTLSFEPALPYRDE